MDENSRVESEVTEAAQMPEPEIKEEPVETVPAAIEEETSGSTSTMPDENSEATTTEAVQVNPEENKIDSTVFSANTDSKPEMDAARAPLPENKTSFIRTLLAKANAKIHFNRQKKINKLIEFASKKEFITNKDVRDLLHSDDATARIYLEECVRNGKLVKEGNFAHAKYKIEEKPL